MHVKYQNPGQAVSLIRQCMATGMPLVFDDYPDSVDCAHSAATVDGDPMMNSEYWGQDPVHGVVGANLYSLREFQGLPAHHIRYENEGAHEHPDSAIRESNDLHPYVAATLLEFESWLKMPGKIRCILDLTCGFPQPDKITEYAHASFDKRQTDK